MNGPQYTVDIDRLVLTDLDVTPVEAERIRVQVAGELQRLLMRRDWSNAVAAADVARVRLPLLSLERPTDDGTLAAALARHIVQALPGTRQAEAKRSQNG